MPVLDWAEVSVSFVTYFFDPLFHERICKKVSLRSILAIVGAIVCLALVPASALGESLSNDAYSTQGTQVLGATGGDSGGGAPSGTVSSSSESSSSGVLPFTGLQLAMIGLAGVALVGSGFALRRAHH
jgi:hypothetical protein